MSKFVSFPCPIGEKICRNHVVAAHAITSALTGATPPSFFGFRPDDLIVSDFRLAQFFAEVPVSFIANSWFFSKFFVDGRVYFQVVPFILKDLFEIG